MNHLISIDQLNLEMIDRIFNLAANIKNNAKYNLSFSCNLKGKIITNLFYEPSTRTSSSFYAAMNKLGGSVIPINEVSYSSVVKGETLEDTIQTLAQYSDAIVLRHNIEGAAQRAAAVSPVPIINAGDGAGEHPTQALLDLFTIISEFHNNKPQHITMMGDLKYGRTVHSLTKLLRKYWPDITIATVSPEILKMPNQYPIDEEYDDLSDVIHKTDVLYMTRIQKERLLEIDNVDILNYSITLTDMDHAKPEMLLMHPFPRVNEIPKSIDDDPRAIYFKQIKNGMFVRMALLYLIIAENKLFDIDL